MTGKSEAAFRTIGEVAESLDLPQHVLRFWETRFSEIEPIKRAGGRRYYRPRDVELVAAIRHLLYGQGYTIKGVQRLLKEQGVRAVIENARGSGPGPRGLDIAAPPLSRPDKDELRLFQGKERATGPAEDGETLVLAEFEETAANVAARSSAAASESPGTNLIALAPRGQATLTLPAVRIMETPAESLRREDAERLREALADLAECKRMLELTRRWRD